MAVLKPTPSTPPIKAEAGTRQFSKMTSQVCEPFCPIFWSIFPRVIPGLSASTKNAEIPPEPLISGLVLAITVKVAACGALVI